MECLIIFLYFRETQKFSQGNFNIWAILHILIIVFLILAARGIYKDSKLIKESNQVKINELLTTKYIYRYNFLSLFSNPHGTPA